jgi:phage terminase small subunit
MCWNASAAARRAGYAVKTAYEIGHENLKKPEIREAIAERLTELTMSADEVLTRLTEQARGNIMDFVALHQPPPTQTEKRRQKRGARERGSRERGDGGQDPSETQAPIWTVDLHRAEARGVAHLVKKLKAVDGGVEIELYDAQSALGLLGRAHGLFVDKTALTDPSGDHEYGESAGGDAGARRDRAVAALAEALRAGLSPAGGGGQGAVDAAKPATVAGDPKPGG